MCPLLLDNQLSLAKSDNQSKPSARPVNPVLMSKPCSSGKGCSTRTHLPALALRCEPSAQALTSYRRAWLRHSSPSRSSQPKQPSPLHVPTAQADATVSLYADGNTRSAPSWELREVRGRVIWWLISKRIITQAPYTR